jgi:hypothetical protein
MQICASASSTKKEGKKKRLSAVVELKEKS